MRNLVLFFLPVVLLCAAERPQRAKKTPPQPLAKTARTVASAPAVIPSGAIEIEPHLFRHTDANGKTWLYRRTPFGVSKIEEAVARDAVRAQAAAVAAQSQDVRVVKQDGDIVQFERATPMGKYSWQRKRAELTPEEKTWVEKSSQSAASGSEK